MKIWTNYEKGVQDGYHVAKCNILPNKGPEGGGEDTPEYKQGFADGQAQYLSEIRTK